MSEVKKQNKILEQAMAYHANGYSVFPCKKDKTPMLAQWKPYQEKQATDEQVLEWFSKPNTTIAIATGKLSGIIVIDIDTYKGAVDIFPETFTVRTGNGGLQKYYKHVDGFTISASSYPSMPFVDLRSDGGYVIAPPSITDYIDKNTKKRIGGEYTVLKNLPLAPFPLHLFPKQKQKKSITELTTAKNGTRNTTLASFAGKLLQATKEEEWFVEVLPAVQRASKTYNPIPSDKEVLTVFNSIMKKEKARREALTSSPVVVDGQPTGENMAIMKNKAGTPYCNMANVVAVLEAHPDFRSKIRYNTFTQEIEVAGKALQDEDTIKVQHTLQTRFGLHSITRDAVYSALVHCAYSNCYDEAQDWLQSLKWDGEQRLFTWLSSATGVEDNSYHRGIGTQWWIQMANRIMNPGCLADYMLVVVGGQGLGKTSLFRIIGGKWYKNFTGGVEGKDFFLQMRGAILMDLDEGATLYKSEAIKIKSIITTTHDEFRAPYDRIPKKYPRHFVFSMSTNEIEPFRDVTGNRRYWAVDIDKMINFKWLEDNREQLFAEAFHWLKDKDNPEIVPQVSQEEAERIQEEHLPNDSWTDLICDEVRSSYDYSIGNPDYCTTVKDVFMKVFSNESAIRLDKKIEIRMSNIFKKELGLAKYRKMIDGENKNRWMISPKKIKQLQARNIKKTETPLEELSEELRQKEMDF